MKRALAERAKQAVGEGGPSSVDAAPSASESLSSSPPPSKLARLESPPSTSAAPAAPSAPAPIPSTSTSSSTIPKPPMSATSAPDTLAGAKGAKRQRPLTPSKSSSSIPDDDDEDDTNASAFYLRHQNRALASELGQANYRLKILEKERDFRRTQCLEACQALNQLEATWSLLEQAVLGEPSPASSSTNKTLTSTNENAPMTSGTGASVEMIGPLLQVLSNLGQSSAGTGGANGKNSSSSDDAPDTDQKLAELSKHIAQRATALQSWIVSLLPKVSSSPDSSLTEPAKLAEELSTKRAELETLRQQLEEMTQSREEYQQSEKRVRRGLYRLQAKRMPLKEVMKAIERADDDPEEAAAWMEATVASAASAVPTTPLPSAAVSSGDGSTVDSAQLAQLQQQIKKLEEVASSREEQIQKVRQLPYRDIV